MLAVQQTPRMGSTQPELDPFMPFGYAVDENQEPIFDAPDPAPGAPLLTETDTKFLSSFFEDMTANQYSMPSFGEGLNFSDVWLDLPPQFMGTATSFGPQSTSSFGPEAIQGYPQSQLDLHGMLPESHNHMMPPPPPPQSQIQTYEQQQHSDDVLNAAATLLQNGSSSRSGPTKHHDSPLQRRPIGPPVGHLRHQPLEEFKAEGQRVMANSEHDDHTFTQWMWGSKDQRPARTLATADYQWGSDSNFTQAQAYTPHTHKESMEAIQEEHLKCLDCFEVNKSAAPTRPGSPTNGHSSENTEMSGLAKRPDDAEAPPRKRRKSKNHKESGDDEEDDDAKTPKSSSRKSKTNGSLPSPPTESGTKSSGRRRKSTMSGAKAARENLTEEQKRENHIRSEQKRRTLIKEGFDDLCDLVPGLKGGGFSKSTMLVMTAEWLEDLLRGNEMLASQLSIIEGS